MTDAGNNLADEIASLRARLAELEERVTRLEEQPAPTRAISGGVGPTEGVGSSREGLPDAISQALEGLGEADAGAIRQHLIKSGFAADVARSEINKALYASPARFQIARQEGAKPLWKRADA